MEINPMWVAVGVFALLLPLILLLSGPNASKALKRRLNTIRERYATSNEAALQRQMRRTIAARLPQNDGGLVKLLPNPERLAMRLRRTGKDWTLRNYMVVNLGITVVVFILLSTQGAPFLLGLLAGLILGFGLPHMIVGMMIKKRVLKFNERFPDAIDLLVRGLRSGLPIAETLAAVANEIPGPVGIEFKGVIERVRIGKSMDAALQDTADMLGTPEFQFFCITLAIQRETGGNLAETLANLSEVLRKRAQMKLKIKAMSSEAKASAWIVGALPFVVFGMIFMVSPDYISRFFVEQRLIVTGLGGLVWMGIGVAAMAKMVNFEI